MKRRGISRRRTELIGPLQEATWTSEERQQDAVTYWRPRRRDEPEDADEQAIALDRYWRNKYGASILELLNLGPVAHAAQRDAMLGRFDVADRVTKRLRRYLRELRAELEKPALKGRARAGCLAVLLERERVSRSGDPRYGRGRATLAVDADVCGDVASLVTHMEDLVVHKWPALLAGAERSTPHGTKRTDAEWNAAADAVVQWITARYGRPDLSDAAAALVFLGWDRLDDLPRAVQVNHVREACRRRRGEPASRRHLAGFSQRRAGD
jgi:hypothetical protein